MIEQNSPAFWRATLALCLGSLMIFANIYAPQPLLPSFVEQYGISRLSANWSITITTLTLAISLLFYGALSDALGRKRLMVYSMVGIVVTTFALGFVSDYSQFLILRAVQGFCLGGLPAIAIAYLGDEFSRKALVAAVGFYIAANTLSGILGRLVGGSVGEWLGTSAVFQLLALGSALILICFYWLLPASQQFQPRPLRLSAVFAAFAQHLSNPVLVLAYLLGGLGFMLFINQYSYITFVLADAPYHLSPFWLGLLFLTYLSGTLASGFSGRLALRYPQTVCMSGGIIIFMLGIVLTLGNSLWLIISGFLLNAFGFFFYHSQVSSWVSRHATQSRASASALYLVFYYLGASVGGLYLDPFWQWLAWPGVVMGSLLVLLVTLGMGWLLYRYERDLTP